MRIGDLQDLSLDNGSFDGDWLKRSKAGLINGTRYFAVPMWLLFGICDYIYAPTKIAYLIALRLAFVPLTLLYAEYVAASTTKRSFLRRYSGFVASYGLIVLLFTAIVQDPHNIYFVGDFAVVAGAFTFVLVTQFYLYLLAAYIFVPFFAYAIATGMAVNYTYHFVVFLFVSVAIVLVFEHERRHLMSVHLREYHARQALRQILNERESTIKKLADDVRLLSSGAGGGNNAIKAARQAAHDIRSPVSAMNAIAKRVENISPELADMLKLSSKRINDIAESLTTPADRHEGGGSNRAADLNESISAVVKEKLMRLASKNVEITIDVDRDLPKVSVAQADFERMISNLIENAIDAVGERGIIEIRATRTGGVIQVEIRDNGCGISPENLSKVGQYGFTHGKSNGSGLGFSHAREVVSSVGGKIAISSKVGEFTSVLVEVPVG